MLNISRLYLKEHASAAGLACVIFLWPIQISLLNVGIPFYFLVSPLCLFLSKFTKNNIFMFIVGILLLFTFTIIQSAQGVIFTTPLRSFMAIPFFIFIFTCISRWLDIILKSKQKFFFRFCSFFLQTQLLVQLSQLILWKLGLFNTHYKYLFNIPRFYGFFLEPSLVAFGLSPFVYLFIFHRKLAFLWLGKRGVISIFLIFIICPSSTLVCVLGIASFFRLLSSSNSIRSFIIKTVSASVIGFILFWVIINIPATSARVFDLVAALSDPARINGSLNFSSLLFLKGWQMACAGLKYYSLGVGFLNFQFLNDYSSVSFINDFLYEANAFEGTSVGFKLIGEFGYLGFVILLANFYIFFKNIKKNDQCSILENFILFGLIIGCIRGPSYFDGFTIIALVVIFNKLGPSLFHFSKSFLLLSKLDNHRRLFATKANT
ncbi:hypothetical protein ACTVJH_15095 [Desulfoplanes sp. PS50]